VTIYYDIAAVVHGHAGLGRYAESLARALLVEHDGALTFFYNADPTSRFPASLEGQPRRTVEAGRKSWRMQAWLGQLLRLRFDHMLPGAELYHATEHLLMPLHSVPTVLTIHDLLYRHYPQYHKPLNFFFLNLAVPNFCRRASTIVAVSEYTKQDLIQHYHLPAHKISVIYEAAAPHFRPQPAAAIAAARQRYHLPERYLMTLCVIEPRKNHAGFLRAFERLCMDDPGLYWVIGGKKGWLYEGFMGALERSPARDRVILAGYIAEQDLAAVYGGALAFVFPSLGEGFGLEPVEAMACGTPVVCSSATSLPEVGGAAVRYFDPHDAGHMVDALQPVLARQDLRDEMRHAGLAQAAQFSWQRAAAETWALYQQVIAQRQT
jgi:glycosyltransferase involved in cell wall biosynthesis